MKTLTIIGRPNVGKSTLFNRLLSKRRALVHNEAGVTRDRMIEPTSFVFFGKTYPFQLVDTGGLGGEGFGPEIQGQVEIALAETDAVLVVFDGKVGLVEEDKKLIRFLRKKNLKIPLYWIVNKIDQLENHSKVNEFFSEGLDAILPISAEHNLGIDDLKEALLPCLEVGEEVPDKRELPVVTILGRPNAGKSTLTNALLGKNRMIVHEKAGTTSDRVYSEFSWGAKRYQIADTPGVKRKSKTSPGLEKLSFVQTKKAIADADLVILLIDGEIGPTDQDEKIAGLAEEAGCGLVIGINKVDLLNESFKRGAEDFLRSKMKFLHYAPVVLLSGKQKMGLKSLWKAVEKVLRSRSLRVPTPELSRLLRHELEVYNPKNARLFYAYQLGGSRIRFKCHVNAPQSFPFSTRRHLVNSIRKTWGFSGNPITLVLH